MNCQSRFGRALACASAVPTSVTYFVTGRVLVDAEVLAQLRG